MKCDENVNECYLSCDNQGCGVSTFKCLASDECSFQWWDNDACYPYCNYQCLNEDICYCYDYRNDTNSNDDLVCNGTRILFSL